MGPVTYKIELPPSMKRAHNVFHVSKLKQYQPRGDDTGRMEVVIDAEGNVEDVVAEILDKKRQDRKTWYLVRFYGDPKSEAIWKPRSDLSNCMDIVNDFEKSLKTSPRASKSKRGVSVRE